MCRVSGLEISSPPKICPWANFKVKFPCLKRPIQKWYSCKGQPSDERYRNLFIWQLQVFFLKLFQQSFQPIIR